MLEKERKKERKKDENTADLEKDVKEGVATVYNIDLAELIRTISKYKR